MNFLKRKFLEKQREIIKLLRQKLAWLVSFLSLSGELSKKWFEKFYNIFRQRKLW